MAITVVKMIFISIE